METQMDIARPAHLGSFIADGPHVNDMIQAAAVAGPVSAESLGARLDDITATAESTYLGQLDEVEKVRAEEFLCRARAAAEEAWRRCVSGAIGPEAEAPRVLVEVGDDPEKGKVKAGQARGRRQRIPAPLLRALAAVGPKQGATAGGHVAAAR